MAQALHPVLTPRLFTDRKCFGPGVAALLRGVELLGSLRAAAQNMGMAYSKAWHILREAEDQLGFKLLASSVGGKNGGGARLTPEGERFLAAYEAWAAALRVQGEALFRRHFADWLGSSEPPEA